MNNNSDRDKILSEFEEFVSRAAKAEEINLKDFREIKFAENIFQFLEQGECFWKDNKFEEAHAKFWQGHEFLRERIPSIDPKRDKRQYSLVELCLKDLLALSEAVLFDREYYKLFQAESLRDLKGRLFSLWDYVKKNLSLAITHNDLKFFLIMKFRYFFELMQIVVLDMPPESQTEPDYKKDFDIIRSWGFNKVGQELFAIQHFVKKFKECLSKYGDPLFIPIQEEAALIKILNTGMLDYAEKKPQEEKNLKRDKGQEYEVFLSSGVGVTSRKENESGIHKNYIPRKKDYDIFVYEETVYKKMRDHGKVGMVIINLDRNILKLLILFLRYKNTRIPYEKLYGKAWDGSINIETDAVKKMDTTVMNRLKTAVNELKNELETIKNFSIPHAKEGGYICEGDFESCLILKKSTSQQYTLEEA